MEIEASRGPEFIGTRRADGTVVGREPFVKATPGELPHDYWYEVGSSQAIAPGITFFLVCRSITSDRDGLLKFLSNLTS